MKSSIFSNSVQLQWQTPPDDPNGTGVIRYDSIPSTGIATGYFSSELYDPAVSPATTYNYPIWAVDAHSNYASQSTVTVTTPPAGAVDPRRVGVRPTGSYWGGLGENIDLLSGNLNFSLPLLQAQARGGWKLPISLSYNSQNWRQDPATWNLGADVGYGYGWKLLAGSLTPYWQGYYWAHHYTFTDASGAEYRLDVNTNGVWTSKESIYVSYDSNTIRVYFNDGSFWVRGCTSAGTEQDAGTMYPTLLEDANGNQVFLRYEPGVGITWPDSSARIREIEDTRALADGWGGYRTYTINYDSDPVLPHITSIVSWIGSGENYLFAMSGLQTLVSPFDGSTQGSTQYLRSVTINGPNLVHQLETNSSGELTKVTFPYGGYLRWVYANQTYVGGRVQREVATRYLSKDGSVGAERAYTFVRDPGDTGRTSHWWAVLDDPDGQSEKAWWFQTDTSQFNFGLVTAFEARPHHWPATAGGRHDDYTWTTDAAGNRYIAAVLTTEDMGNPTQVQKKTEQTRDVYGNVTQTKTYNYGNLTTPARTYTNTYLTGANYTSRYIFNRLASSTVTDGSVTTTLASNLFDGGCPLASLTAMTSARQHDDSNYGQTFFYRGNVTQTTTPAGVTCTMYNTGGVAVTTTRNGVQLYGAFRTYYGGLTESLQWNSFLGLTQETGPNGDRTALLYDAYSRLTQTTRPQGAVTTYTYITTPGTATSTTNGHWTKKSLDGFGRVIKLEAGHDSTTVSQTDTEYDSCGCSPIGKMKRVSMAHAPAGTVYWTTYSYDGLGRTVSVVSPDGASTKTYAYSGNTVTVTDEAGKWKKYTMDAMGNVTQVEEPKPAADTVHVGNYFTTYTYDVLNHLKQVTMPRRGVTQTRTLNYGTPPGANLLSATNPENGTVTYTYNANNLVATKTDAKNQQTQYTYDANNRVTQIRHYPVAGGGEDTCQQVNFYYDSNPYVGGYSAYASGRLAARTYQASNCGQAPNAFTEMFSYTPDGHMNKKLLRVWRTVSGQFVWADLNSSYAYDNEGKMTSMTYPQALDGSNNVVGGGTYTYGYDSMARMSSMTGGANAPASISNATYGPGGELLSLAGTVNETRTYNNRLQLTRISAPHMTCTFWTCTNDGVDTTYTYSANQNNGWITQQTDNVSGEQVTYQYDELNRLISAVTATNPSVPQWGQAFMYDGFGSLTDKSVTKGSAPVWHGLVDPATNRASGFVYDANGNAGVSGLLYTYDVENRLTFQAAWAQSTEYGYGYGYNPDNQRVYKATSTYDPGTGGFPISNEEITFWGATGQRMGMYSLIVNPGGSGYAPSLTLRWMNERAYFGGRLIWRSDGGPQAVYSDRVGSIGKYFPYGEERPTATVGNAEKFATYYRDDRTGLDYAMNRYYDSGTGRFLTPDPYKASAGTADPGSWNRYAYVQNDPVNFKDPRGLFSSTADSSEGDEGQDEEPACVLLGTPIYDPSLCGIYNFPVGSGNYIRQGGTIGDWRNVRSAVMGDVVYRAWQNLSGALVGDSDCASWLASGATLGASSKGNNQLVISLAGNEWASTAFGDNSAGTGVGGETFGNASCYSVGGNRVDIIVNRTTFTTNVGLATFPGSTPMNVTTSTDQYRAYVLLHEFAHLLGAPGFRSENNDDGLEKSNADLLNSKCAKTINTFATLEH